MKIKNKVTFQKIKRVQRSRWKEVILLFALIAGLSGCQNDPLISEEGNLVPKTVENDSSLPSVSLNGTKFHIDTFGNPANPLIVVLHGGPGSDYRSLLTCKAFADSGYYVVFYDQRGSGLSKREGKDVYTVQIMIDDLNAIISHFRTSPNQKIYLLGHSWGAILATAYINQYPEAINGAILLEPGGFVWQDIMDYVIRARSFSFFGETLNDATYLDQFITGNEDEHAVLDYKFALLASADGAKDNPIGNEGSLLFWRHGAVVNRTLFDLGKRDEPDWTTNLSSYKTQILFGYSERNKAYGFDYAKHVSSAYPNARLEIINDAGHDMLSFSAGWNHFFPLSLNYLKSLQHE